MQKQIPDDGFSSKKVKQFFIIAILLLTGILLVTQLMFILSAFFGAVTLYIILRKPHKRLIRKYKWKNTSATIILITGTILLLLLPIYFTIQFVAIRISPYITSHEPLINTVNTINTYISNRFDFLLLTPANLTKIKEIATKIIPSVIGSGLIIVTDLVLLYFLLWFMLNNSFKMERWLKTNSPFNRSNTQLLITETKKTVMNNAIGILLLGLAQGLIAILGYFIFGVKDPVLWGLITGAASVIPFAGTMIVWVPMTILLFANGQPADGIGLGLYGLILIGGIDNVLRFLLQKRLAQTHPIITVFGVIVGLNLFGFWGLIYGPLMFSLLLLLGKIYKNEYMGLTKTKTSAPA